MSSISTHVLDTTRGVPAAGVPVRLERVHSADVPVTLATQRTGEDGRVVALVPATEHLAPGRYRLVFDTAAYFARLDVETFYAEVVVDFVIRDRSHYHVPLLLSPFGYSTYRGS